jgi:ferredoxin--NADP+ reductase
VAGRVLDGEQHLTGKYVTGWIRRGPSGVIGTNKKDGQEAAASILADTEAGSLNEPTSDADVAELLAERGVDVVTWAGWERIDAHERERAGETGRPRVKLTRWDELHDAAREQTHAR